MKLKESAIGVKTMTQTLGMITVKEKHLHILLREGRHDLIDGIVSANELVALKDKKVRELREIAEGLEGYSPELRKQELLDLIDAAPKSE